MRLLLLLLPWLELFSLIELGVKTSALFALLYVFATFVLGLALLRLQGERTLERMRDVQLGRIQGTQLLVDDLSLGLAGLLLLIPGLLTDCAALLVLVGPLRRALARLLGAPRGAAPSARGDAPGSVTIDGEFYRVDSDQNP